MMSNKLMSAVIGSVFLLATVSFAGSGGSGSHGGWGVVVKPTSETYFLDDFAAHDSLGTLYFSTTNYKTIELALQGFQNRVEMIGLNSDESSRLIQKLREMIKKIEIAPEMQAVTKKSIRSDYVPFTIQGVFTHRASNSNYSLSPIIAFWDEQNGLVEKNTYQWKKIRPYGRVSAAFHEWYSTIGRKSRVQSPHQTIDARESWIVINNLLLSYNRDKVAEAIRLRLSE